MIQNRRASFDYELLERFEAGLVLTGSEVKALRQGGVTLGEAYARVRGGEVWLEGLYIPPYKEASYNNHEPRRPRKLLLRAREIAEVQRALERKGLTLVPTKLYFKNGWAKLEVALGRGKKRFDKRQDAAKRDAQRQIERALKR
ncbi:SsrA-binding protein SmpB [Truepera radiovictrix]|uniref:SsrA-binding protein n=1 Tax=Truepera radiovictrix (strain DSM 17093 / CIP 108686 / LMG 22925 / RQ-24) TaxID=649638 RepID=D7CY66_TRURR|nr:SsrA-binding protein SmpB [Truepera radiovictrix]ADI14705.1 SsrA-binding protein [Truepera radiovictrix DSM 17093]WMT56745.1 SsrA-binding protein SmpB [Truepera radiovictrix]